MYAIRSYYGQGTASGQGPVAAEDLQTGFGAKRGGIETEQPRRPGIAAHESGIGEPPGPALGVEMASESVEAVDDVEAVQMGHEGALPLASGAANLTPRFEHA